MTLPRLRILLYAVSIVAAIGAIYLSYQDTRGYNVSGVNAIDSGADGGAAGFAVMSGLALVAVSITYLRKEE